jgi:2-polyprenyl-6-methoxyphenol hydroxylase-like FAD-dependent oxidoreductase
VPGDTAAAAPDLYDNLIVAGVAEAPLSTQMPPSLPDRSAWPGDEQLTLLMTRRSTLDWVLRRAAAAQTGVTVRGGVQVTGLISKPGRPPHVTGVSTDDGDLSADLVVDATGRRSVSTGGSRRSTLGQPPTRRRNVVSPTTAATIGCVQTWTYQDRAPRGSLPGSTRRAQLDDVL